MSSALADHWLVRALGWAILHSLWQGVVIAAIVALLLRALARSTANVRYVIGCAGLVAMAASWGVTAANHLPSPSGASQGAAPAAIVDAFTAAADMPSPALELPRDAANVSSATSWRSRLDSWSAAVVFAWLLGVCLFSGRVAFGWLQVQRLRTMPNQDVPAALLDRARSIAVRLRVTRPVEIAQSALVSVPTVLGWLQPIVLLPVSALSGLPTSQLDAIIAHELAHVRRHDYLVNIAQTAIEVLLFYHPACWWISRPIRSEREHCCDDLVVTVCGDPVDYATALTELETLRGRTPALSLAATDGPLLRRVRRLLRAPASVNETGASWIPAVLPLLVLGFALTSIHAAQSPVPSPGRNVPDTEGVMQGRIVDAVSGRPLSSVRVELIGPDRAITVSTGEDGRYEAGGLQPGKYRVSAMLAGYADAHFGQRGLYDVGVLAEVRGGQITSGVDLKMRAAGSVGGRIFDQDGNGVAGVEVELVTRRDMPGDRQPGAGGFAQTIDGGDFEFKQVLPGDYWVRAYLPQPRHAAAGVVRQLRAQVSELRAASDGRIGFRSTFYPGVAHLEEAQPLHVDAGQALFGIDFALVKAPTRHVTGRVIDERGQPATEVEVGLHSMGTNAAGGQYAARVDRNGRFDLVDVVAGEYMIMVQDKVSPWRWAAVASKITVDDEDVVDLDLRARIGAHVEGRIVRENGITRALDPAGMRIMFEHRIAGGGMLTGAGRPVAGDGTFSLDIPAGPTTIAVIGVPKGWMVRRVLIDDVEIDDRPFDPGDGARRRVDVVLTDRLTQIFGTVADNNGHAVMGVDVLVYPDGTPEWTPGARSMRQVRADAFGRFQIDALRPGDYLAVALDHPAPFALEEPDLLQRLSASAMRVRLGEGERRAIAVRVASVPTNGASR